MRLRRATKNRAGTLCLRPPGASVVEFDHIAHAHFCVGCNEVVWLSSEEMCTKYS